VAETESEFQGYTGDCVWAAVHMGAHRLAPEAWPVPSASILNRLTREAIAAGIGVGQRGEATPGQLKTMLARWGMRYRVGYDYNGSPIGQAQLQRILDGALSRGKPVLLGFTNGQALAGDEHGLHGHEIVVLHPMTAQGYPCGDGDNPRCRDGELVYYPLSMLEAAAPDSAYVLEEVPGMTLQLSDAAVAAYFEGQADGSWKCKQTGHTIAAGMLATYRDIAALGTLAGLTALGLPLSDIVYQPAGECAVQAFERGILVWDPKRKLDNPPGVVGDYYLAHIDDPQTNPVLAAQMHDLTAQVAALQAQLTQAQQAASIGVAATTAIRALAAALADVETK
jgi:hypothetical protein